MPTTIIESIGSGGDHASIDDFETATDNDHVAADEIRVGRMTEDFTVSAFVQFAGSTVDATHYRVLEADAGNAWDPVTASGRVVTSALTNSFLLTGEANFRFQRFKMESTGGTGELLRINGVDDCFVIRMFIDQQVSSALGVLIGGQTTFINCILTQSAGSGQGYFVETTAGDESKFYNCDAYNWAEGFRIKPETLSGFLIQNCASVDCTDDYYNDGGTDDGPFTDAGTFTNNLSSDTSAPGTLSQESQTSADTFNDVANDDFTLAIGSAAIGNGVDLSGTFPGDFDNVTRTVPWTIGAYIAAITPLILRPHTNVHLRR